MKQSTTRAPSKRTTGPLVPFGPRFDRLSPDRVLSAHSPKLAALLELTDEAVQR